MPPNPSTISIPVDKRILLHIMEYSKFDNEFEVPFAISQEGIARAIGIRRDNIPRAVKDLKNEGLVIERVARVTGVYRKRKVYFLTDQGFEYIREMRAKILATEVMIKDKGELKPVKLSEIKTKIKNSNPLGLMEILNRISYDNVLDLKDLEEKSSTEEQKRIQAPKLFGAPAGKVQFVEEIFEAPTPRYFVGRSKELGQVIGWLQSEEHKIVVVYGIPGIGKTTLASRVLRDFSGKKHIFWYRFHR